MICKSCNLKEICKTFDFINKQSYADIEVNTCKFNSDNITMHERRKEIPVDPKAIASYSGKAKPDLRAAEKKVLNIPDKPEPVKVTCSTCNGVTYDDDINICSKCGKPMCSNCGTAADGQLFCNECWEKE